MRSGYLDNGLPLVDVKTRAVLEGIDVWVRTRGEGFDGDGNDGLACWICYQRRDSKRIWWLLSLQISGASNLLLFGIYRRRNTRWQQELHGAEKQTYIFLVYQSLKRNHVHSTCIFSHDWI